MTVLKQYTVGVLALQGAFKEHIELLQAATQTYSDLNFKFIEVRTPEELITCDSLVIPGGESTAMSLIAERTGMFEPLLKYIQSDKPIWGTCAGLIFLAKQIINGRPEQKILGALDIQVKRNAFGRQQESFESPLDFGSFIPGVDNFPTVFIRAPVISKILETSYNKEFIPIESIIDNQDQNIIYSNNKDFQNNSPVQVLHKLDSGLIVAVRQGKILGTSFHPELTNDFRFHKWFIDEFVLKN
ncbi:CTP synthase [Wickerhamomyces ciferrii]|uniref:glutaminase n=1 Tax=Wickerhamomyces ciferrii (strain ATCC 14091 / BCRC 22168 / CBS 111 / JCM 3599 / NBRC 0793 / NRRL Y-1031 F-60-10) TaxID=1206466 RepID=K0KQU0_WICCF|nr:CTP synthase [Wickerhamomyces ciferrii]CCH45461.1 CTP synthase [Wickerhamomyces ciferrii]